MSETISILDRRWIRGPKKLQALEITLFFNYQEVTLEICSRNKIKELLKIHFFTLSKATQHKLRKDLARELKFNQKQCKRVIRINNKIQNNNYAKQRIIELEY